MATINFGFTAQQIVEEVRTTRQKIEELKEWTRSELAIPELTDEQFIIFILGCKNDVRLAKRTIKQFYTLQLENPEFFENRNIKAQNLKRFMDVVDIVISPVKTDDGCVIVFSRLRDTHYANLEVESAAKVMGMLLHAIVYNDPPKSVMLIIDLTGASIMHLAVLRLRVLNIIFKYLQDCIPVPFQGIHVINPVFFLNKVVALIKPFLNQRSFEKMHFHPKDMNMEVFYDKWVPKKCLPKEIGGDLPEISVLKEDTINKFVAMENYFEEEERQRRAVYDSLKNCLNSLKINNLFF